MGKSEKKPVQKESNCNVVCKVYQVNLNVTYGKSVAIKACGNIFKPPVGEKTNKKLIYETLPIACR